MKKNLTILITGASSGIGRELALAYAAPNTTLLLTGRNLSRLDEAAQLCIAKGAQVEISDLNVTDSNFKEKIILWDKEHIIDIAIANAGISSGTSAKEINSAAQFSDVIDTNLHGTFNTLNPLIPRMIARHSGHIVLMSSMAGFRGMPTAPAYSISKVAVRAYGDALRPLLKKDGVKVSTIFPGFVKTPLTDKNSFTMPFLIDAEKAAEIIKEGIAKDKATIAFPWQMYFLSSLLNIIPRAWGDKILQHAPKKN